jgi:hypothetical protein
LHNPDHNASDNLIIFSCSRLRTGIKIEVLLYVEKNLINKTIMKTIATIMLAFVLMPGIYSQDEGRLSKSEIRRMQREQRKADEAVTREGVSDMTDFMIRNQQFVLEADFLSGRTGSRIPVIPTINFIMIDTTAGVVQFGSATSAGYNGVGGTTAEGRINHYKYTMIGKNKDSYSVSMNFMSTLGIYDISIMVNSRGYANATIRGNWSGVLNYHGKLVTLEASRVYKAHPSY